MDAKTQQYDRSYNDNIAIARAALALDQGQYDAAQGALRLGAATEYAMDFLSYTSLPQERSST